MVDAWAIDSSAGAPSYSGYDLRLTTIAPFMVGGGLGVGVRTGVRPSGSGTDLLVQAQASPNMSVLVNPGVIVAQGTYSATQGPYTWALDTQTTLTIATAHATLDRTDLVAVRIRDGNIDSSGARDGAVIVITGTPGSGTPSLPTDATYVTIAQISVPHASTSVTSSQITDKRPFTAAIGGTIPCASTARPTGAPLGQLIYETDTKWYRTWDGAYWRPFPGTAILALTSSPLNVTGLDNGVRTVWSYSWTPPHPGTYLIRTATPFDGVGGEQAHIWLYQGSTLIDANIVTFPAGSFVIEQWLMGIINVTSTAAININVQSQRTSGGNLFNSRSGGRMLHVVYCGVEGIPATG